MVNYKPPKANNFVGVGGIIHAVDTKFKLISLYYNFNNGTAAKSLFNSATGAVYIVTTGKTFVCCGIIETNNGAAGTSSFYEGDTLDAETTLKGLSQTGQAVDEWTTPITFEIASAKYLTSNPSSSQIEFTTVIGYEK